MKNKRTTTTPSVEILWNDDYVGAAITLEPYAFVDGVCKAGTPISSAGHVANDENALGVLLYDVYADRPQGTVIIGGYINAAAARKHSGVYYAPEALTAMKNIVLMPENWSENA